MNWDWDDGWRGGEGGGMPNFHVNSHLPHFSLFISD